MTAARRSALVLSTTPPLPRDYGNRNWVHQTVSLFRQMGFSVSFLLYPIDRDWAEEVPGYHRQLADSFDYFAVVPNSRELHQNARGYHHAIDEWWDDNIAQQLIWLFQRKGLMSVSSITLFWQRRSSMRRRASSTRMTFFPDDESCSRNSG